MNDFTLICRYLSKCSSKLINKFKQKNIKEQTFSQILIQPEGAKYLNSVYMGKNKVFGYNTTLYKIKREDNSYYYASYVYKKKFTQVILTDDWEKMKVAYRNILNNQQSLIIELDNEGGGMSDAKKSKFGRKRF